MKRLTFFLTVVFLAAGGILERAHAQAQSYPSRPIRMIVPFPPGGGFDAIARPFTEKLAPILGQPVLIENRPGAGGNIGAEVAARSAPDGYTLFFANDFLTTNPAMYASLRYDPLKDFVAITKVGTVPVAIAVHPSVQAKNLKELMALSKTRPLNFGTPGIGTAPHLFGELLNLTTDLKLVHVPYKGSGPAIADALGGQIEIVITPIANLAQHIRAGKLRGIAVLSSKRAAIMPELPTFTEEGIPVQADGCMSETSNDLPLKGLKVLELGHIVAGPTASLILADLGADVIKVENPDGGDQARRMPGASSSFYFFNRNKRSIAVDLKAPEGKKVFLRLVKTVDVCLDNYAPGALDRLGFGYDALSKENPRLICLALKGFLPGPYEHRPSLDELAQMMGGLAFMTGPPGRPLRAGASIIDIGAATYGIIGVLAALQQREQTGRGQMITSGLFETSVFWVGQWMARAVATGEPSRPMAEIGQSVRMGWGIFHLFDTSDKEQVFIGVTSNAHWERFCEEFGLSDLFADERLNSNSGRVASQEWMLPRVRQATGKLTSRQLQEKLERASVPYAPVHRPDQLLDDPHLKATGQLLPTPMQDGKTGHLPKLPFRSNDYDFSVRRSPPGLGEHTREVLAEAGLDAAEIQALITAKVVGGSK